MKNIEKWLMENGLEYSRNQYGNSTYFNDGFSVSGLQVAFYTDGIATTGSRPRSWSGTWPAVKPIYAAGNCLALAYPTAL